VILSSGIAVWVGSWPLFLAPIAVFATANWVHIPFEEAKMRRQFGEEYDSYLRRVRRWL
jgi:protein-S-isoprenylcysteine O-methyltransferase Ste14